MLGNLTSSGINIFDANFGCTSIADVGVSEPLDQLFQRHDSQLLNSSKEITDQQVDEHFLFHGSSFEHHDKFAISGNSILDNLTQLSRQQGQYKNVSKTHDDLTGFTSSQPLISYGESAIATLVQASMEAWSGTTSYSAGQILSANTSSNQWRVVEGTLNADWFTADHSYQYNVFSGNGNVYFGDGYYDVLDLSHLTSNVVTDYTLAPINLGNGARMLDAFQLVNNSYIFFEGIDKVLFADGELDLSITPNDPYFDDQWNLHMMGVHNAWRFSTGNDNVLVGVQDTGLGMNTFGQFHGDLNNDEIWYFPNNIGDDFFREVPGSGYGPKNTSHGTGVQGIISAETNNGMGISGINWESDVFAIDVLDANYGDQDLAEATYNMIQFARSQGQKLVINMSLGGSGSIDPNFEALVASSQQDALFVIASGNDNNNAISNPASLASTYSNVVAVGASWGSETIAGTPVSPGTRISYPGYWGSNYGVGLSLMGPSEVLTTSASPNGFGYEPDFNGTSAAAPNVAGVASLVWSANSNLSASAVKTVLMQTAYDLGPNGYDYTYGSGFVNADAAVRRALALA